MKRLFLSAVIATFITWCAGAFSVLSPMVLSSYFIKLCFIWVFLIVIKRERGVVTVPTIMWLQTSQNVGFLKMCSMKQCPAESTCRGLRDWERDVGGGAQGMAGGTGGMGRLVVCGGAIPMLQRWPVLLLTSERSSVLVSLLDLKKLSALLLRMLLVLKDSERLSLCSWQKQRCLVQEKTHKTPDCDVNLLRLLIKKWVSSTIRKVWQLIIAQW